MARLSTLAYARSGDKGTGANIGILARDAAGYALLEQVLTAERVAEYFAAMRPGPVQRFLLPNLHALNFVLPEILAGGGSRSLRIDAQGKSLGQVLLEMELPEPTA